MCLHDGTSTSDMTSAVVTLKMVAPWGRGSAGLDGDVVLAVDGGLGAEGPPTAALSDLEHKTRK